MRCALSAHLFPYHNSPNAVANLLISRFELENFCGSDHRSAQQVRVSVEQNSGQLQTIQIRSIAEQRIINVRILQNYF